MPITLCSATAAMPIPASILERVEPFDRNLESYLSPDYQETQLRS